MKILLNGLTIVYPISGIGQYTLQLGRALEALLGPGKIFWFGRNSSNDRDDHGDHKDPGLINRIRHRPKK